MNGANLNNAAMMLVSKARNRYTRIDADKTRRGAFFTTHGGWLFPQVRKFIRLSGATTAVDPFAGDWHMLFHVQEQMSINNLVGYDISPRHSSRQNDSLLHIPVTPSSIVITNPPYLAKHSAKRKGIWADVHHYFLPTTRFDLYQIALDQCLSSCAYVVAIVPETFILSDYPKHRLVHASIIERVLFGDTECPTAVACFGPSHRPRAQQSIYCGQKRICTLADVDRALQPPSRTFPLAFNDPNGTIALRAIDFVNPIQPIQFLHRKDLAYDVTAIKESSRLITFIGAPEVPNHMLDAFIARANKRLFAYRQQCGGVHLSPFKGNTSTGTRRRRLDYAAARAILEQTAADLRLCPTSPTLFS